MQFTDLFQSCSETQHCRWLRVVKDSAFEERSYVCCYGLGALAVHGVQLHGADGPLVVRRDANEQQPSQRFVSSVVYDLIPLQRLMPVESFHRPLASLRVPMVDGIFRNQSYDCRRDPFPEYDLFAHRVRFQFSFRLKIEKLDGFHCAFARFASEGDDFIVRVHDGRIRRNRSPHHLRYVGQVDDDDDWRTVDEVSDANEFFRFHRHRVETETRRIDTERCQLEMLLELDRKIRHIFLPNRGVSSVNTSHKIFCNSAMLKIMPRDLFQLIREILQFIFHNVEICKQSMAWSLQLASFQQALPKKIKFPSWRARNSLVH
ncbi:unnamed protein product, partial [Nesidiocoris tenuis]